MRRTALACCARAVLGHAAAVPSAAMNSRSHDLTPSIGPGIVTGPTGRP
jgi:hypothetical protein